MLGLDGDLRIGRRRGGWLVGELAQAFHLLAQLLQDFVVAMFGHPARGQSEQLRADAEDFFYFIGADLAHARPEAGHAFDDAAALQGADGLAHGGAADRESIGQRFFLQAFPRLQHAGLDRLHQPVGDLFRQRLRRSSQGEFFYIGRLWLASH
ncbi:Uncharacterised protein [Bordetella pertussis]|nr:Uncharacterised protein [Bordetella pertussis]CFW45334.1 Uncharacterised protein [Bordetella pertussis]